MMRETYYRQGEQVMNHHAHLLAVEASKKAGEALNASELAAIAIAGLFDAGVTDRALYSEVMQKFVGDNKWIGGSGLFLEPDILSLRKENSSSDAINRFTPYFYHDGTQVTEVRISAVKEAGYDDWYETPKASHHETISGPYIYHRNGADTLWATASAPILVESGKFIGTVTVDFPLQGLLELFGASKPYPSFSAALLDDAGKWLLHPEKSLAGREAGQVIQDEISSVTGNALYTSEAGIVNAIRVLELNGLGKKWFVMVAVEEDELWLSTRTFFRIGLAIAAGLTLLVTGIVWYYSAIVVASVPKPADPIKPYARGDRMEPVFQMEKIDEIGNLAEAIEKLCRSQSAQPARTD